MSSSARRRSRIGKHFGVAIVFKVDPAKPRRDPLHGLDDLVFVLRVEHDGEGAHAAQVLEEERLPFHDRQTGPRRCSRGRRYASDGMILAAVLHMVRNFAFDRYRNFRWFSWYTGIAVLWLVYMAGINGYWLVWDKLAQFIAVATAEWLDYLPIFIAPLARNFLEQGSVNDRFFSLLSFAHLGIPLIAFALIWIHTQRVPEAKTSPPRALKVGLTLSMVVLALIKPALSQGQADLNSSPSILNLDWFYLLTYPLLYSWSPGKVWALTGGITGLCFIAAVPGREKTRQGRI